MKTVYKIIPDLPYPEVYSVEYYRNKKIIEQEKWDEWPVMDWSLNTHEYLPDRPIGQSTLIHNPRIELTDFLDVQYLLKRGIVISKKVLSIFENFNLPNHQLYPITIEYKKELIIDQYFYFYFIEDHSKYIDYSDIDFKIISNEGINVQKLEFQEWMNIINSSKGQIVVSPILDGKKLTLMPFNVDLFNLYRIGYMNHYVSERLMQALQKNSIGFRFIKSRSS